MISVIQSPAEGRVLLDANNTEIKITSTNGDGFYFRALIYVNDILFDEQGWSRLDSFTTIKDLVKLYNSYFESELKTFSENGIFEQIHLKKKISITIQEKRLDNDDIVQSIDLPNFYFLYNVNPIYFDDSSKIQILGINPPVLLLPENGKIVIPFYVKANNEPISIVLKDNFGTLIDTVSTDLIASKSVFIYYFNLSPIELKKDTLFFVLSIKCGDKEVQQTFKLIRFPDFPVKEIYFKNNFGYYLPAYFDGELEIQDSFSSETFQKNDGTNEIFEINEEAIYTINTGSLLQNERAIVNQIASSHEILFKVNGQYRKILTSTKKILEYRDKKHLYAQDLTFSFTKNGKISNYFESPLGADFDDNDFLPNDWLT